MEKKHKGLERTAAKEKKAYDISANKYLCKPSPFDNGVFFSIYDLDNPSKTHVNGSGE
jgi:hypothetical protein